MIATGVTARGLDIRNVMHIVNYDLPSTDHGGIQEYVHRIGRTARIGNEGCATSFYNDRNSDLAPHLVKILMESNQNIPEFLEEFKPAEGEALDFEDESDDSGSADGDGGWGAKEASESGGGWGAAEPEVSKVADHIEESLHVSTTNDDLAW